MLAPIVQSEGDVQPFLHLKQQQDQDEYGRKNEM
jgi:hypothetical protein